MKKRDDTTDSNIITLLWRRWRDLNSRAGYPTYTLSRGASSANLSTSPTEIKNTIFCSGGEGEIRTLGAYASLVFKTSSLNRSDTSPRSLNNELYYNSFCVVCQGLFFVFAQRIQSRFLNVSKPCRNIGKTLENNRIMYYNKEE